VSRFRIFTTGAGIAAVAAVIAGSALAGGAAKKPIALSATFKGKAVVRITGSHADISAQAAGSGVPIGKATLVGKGAGDSAEPCPLFGGPATITAKAGKLNFKVGQAAGSACTDEDGQVFSLSGRATITGGTGKYLKAKGSFKFLGSYDKKTGLFSVKFVGSFTV
jgi:hypothetical protein